MIADLSWLSYTASAPGCLIHSLCFSKRRQDKMSLNSSSIYMKRMSPDIGTVTKKVSLLLPEPDGWSSLWPSGGKLIFLDPGPIELRAHAILVSDGGELRIGSKDKPFRGKASIKLYGSAYTSPFFPYGVKFLAVRNGTLSLHGE